MLLDVCEVLRVQVHGLGGPDITVTSRRFELPLPDEVGRSNQGSSPLTHAWTTAGKVEPLAGRLGGPALHRVLRPSSSATRKLGSY